MGMMEESVTHEPVIRITLDGRAAETVDLAAKRLGIEDPGTLRRALVRAGKTPDGHLDARTPLYLTREVDKVLAKRPGRGVGGGRPRKDVTE